ncbi:MAG: hypothetical protein L3J03_00650 [Desulfobacterales bacterium]|nr:hypothetical protein [Desulfobacterales bacterium]
MSKKVCFMFAKNEDDTLDGLRSTLGLAVANHYSYAVVLNTELAPLSEYHAENMEWIRDMEGEAYSTVPANVENNGFTAITIEELGQKLREMDVIVPYGVQD